MKLSACKSNRMAYSRFYMRYIAPLFVALAFCAWSVCAKADQNPAPVNVGLYNYSVYTASPSTSTVAALPRNKSRAGLLVQNNGGVSIVVKLGSAITSTTDGIVIGVGGSWEPTPPPVDSVYIESTSATAPVTLMEFVK